MSEKDVMFKRYADDNHRFADLVNYLVFKGQPIVKPEKLKSVNIEESFILKTKDEQNCDVEINREEESKCDVANQTRNRRTPKWLSRRAKMKLKHGAKVKNTRKHKDNLLVTRIRDLFKFVTVKRDERTYYAFIGLEHQSSCSTIMAVRSMLYDALAYINQSEANLTKQFPETENLPHSHLIPVITIVVNFSEQVWNAPKSLYEMMPALPDELKPFVPDYHINLIDPLAMDDKDYGLFQTHWGAIFEAYRLYVDKGMQVCYPFIRDSERMKNASHEDIEFIETMTGCDIPINKDSKENNMNAQEQLNEYFRMHDQEMHDKFVKEEVPKIIEDAKPKIIEDARVKFVEEETPKIIEDARLKFVEEETPKIIEDARVKFVEEETPKIIEDAKPKIIEDARLKFVEEETPKILENVNVQVAKRMFELNQTIDMIQKLTLLPMNTLLKIKNEMNYCQN